MSSSTATTGSAYWKPGKPLVYPPFFEQLPPPIVASINYLLHDFLYPYHIIYPLLAAFCWWLTPSFDLYQESKLYYFLVACLVNEIFLWMNNGFFHYFLYIKKVQDMKKKFTQSWGATNDSRFFLNDQVYDNVFYCSVSGVFVWTVYQLFFFNLYSKNMVSTVYYDFWSRPFVSLGMCLFVPFWRHFHFYFAHRLIHFKPLYFACHHVHHRNKNTMPWSGLSMHPLEHLFYFSGPLFWFLILPHHPIHVIYETIHAALTPAIGHTGFEGKAEDGLGLPHGSFHHWLHHHYFECNYGTELIPVDRWFGTFRDGHQVGANLQSTEHK